MHAPRLPSIEPLEPRIAPANLNVNLAGTRATWTDVDGDLVTLTSSKGVLDELDFTFLPQEPGDIGFQLALLDLSNDFAKGSALTFSARRDPVAKVGDGYVNVGWINATFSDLASIVVPGDLGRLDVGDLDPATMAIGNIVVHTAGTRGPLTQGDPIAGGAPTVDWTVFGRLGALTVKGDFGANLSVLGSNTNAALGSTGAITVWGDLFANDPVLTSSTTSGTGFIFSSGAMGAVRILGDVFGGADSFAGSISSGSSIASVYIGGSVVGSSGDASGRIFAQGTIGSVNVAGSLLGGTGNYSGQVFSDGALGSVYVGGSLVSGAGHDDNGTMVPAYEAGSIGSKAKIGKVTVMGGAYGGFSYFGGSIFTYPGSGAKLGAVTIGGVLAGSTEVVGTGQDSSLVFNGIYSDSTLGAVKVGSIAGRNPASPVNIVAKGLASPSKAADALAIVSVTVVRGSYAGLILAGYDAALAPQNSDVQIGAVKIGNNWHASSIAAGVNQGTDIFFGNENNEAFNPPQDNVLIRSKIASITVGGYVVGTSFADDSFAFQAQEIGAVKIGGTVIPMTVNGPFAPADDYLIGVTHDFRIREV